MPGRDRRHSQLFAATHLLYIIHSDAILYRILQYCNLQTHCPQCLSVNDPYIATICLAIRYYHAACDVVYVYVCVCVYLLLCPGPDASDTGAPSAPRVSGELSERV